MQCRAKLIGGREKRPRNVPWRFEKVLVSGLCLRKEARKTRTSSGGGTVGYRAAWTSVRAKVLVDGLCICSRMGAALLNGGSSRRRPQKPGRGRRALRTFGFMPEDAGSDLLPRGIRRQDPVLDSNGAKTPRVAVAGLRSSGDRRSGSGAGRCPVAGRRHRQFHTAFGLWKPSSHVPRILPNIDPRQAREFPVGWKGDGTTT